MKMLRVVLLLVVVALLLSLNGWVVRAQEGGGCGPLPPKPGVPSGCTDLVPECVCSGGVGSGHLPECHWVWVCQH
jgi:hypothetical protein